MSFVNLKTAKILRVLKDAHYDFPRAKKLRSAFEWALTDYDTSADLKQSSGKDFEARALLVIGSSRVGKTVDLDRIRYEINNGDTIMSDGRPAKMVKVTLDGRSTWKDLGAETLKACHFDIVPSSRHNQNEIWHLVAHHAKAHGIVCIHYDECQHIFSRRSADIQDNLIDCFKSILKKPAWPLILVFSGVQELKNYILREEQLAYLVRTITFDEIASSSEEDLHEMNSLCHAYSAKLDLDCSALSTSDFYQRLACACANRWGLAIELLIEALVIAEVSKDQALKAKHFCQAFVQRFELRPGYSPFSIENYEKFFEARAVFELWKRFET